MTFEQIEERREAEMGLEYDDYLRRVYAEDDPDEPDYELEVELWDNREKFES